MTNVARLAQLIRDLRTLSIIKDEYNVSGDIPENLVTVAINFGAEEQGCVDVATSSIVRAIREEFAEYEIDDITLPDSIDRSIYCAIKLKE